MNFGKNIAGSHKEAIKNIREQWLNTEGQTTSNTKQNTSIALEQLWHLTSYEQLNYKWWEFFKSLERLKLSKPYETHNIK